MAVLNEEIPELEYVAGDLDAVAGGDSVLLIAIVENGVHGAAWGWKGEGE